MKEETIDRQKGSSEHDDGSIQQRIERHRIDGNAAYRKGDLEEAVAAYSRALNLDPANYKIYTNRSLAHFRLKNYQSSADDAKKAINICGHWAKGYYRLALAQTKLERDREAIEALSIAGFLEPKDKEILSLSEQTGNKLAETLMARLDPGSQESYNLIKVWITQGKLDPMMNATYNALMQASSFAKSVYAGKAEGLPQKPSKLLEVIQNPLLWADLLQSSQIINNRAATVLRNVKARGAAAGEVMDLEAEKYLWQQVFREAFARETIKIVQRRVSHAQAMNAFLQMPIAAAMEHSEDVLSDKLAKQLVQAGWVKVRNFMGEDWLPLVKKDAERYLFSGKRPASSGGTQELHWLEPEPLKAHFPALAEAREKVSSLPAELNSQLGLQLRDPGGRACCLARYKHLEEKQELVSGFLGPGAAVLSRFQVNCLYTLSPNASTPFLGTLEISRNEERVKLELEDDSLILYCGHTFQSEGLHIVDETIISIQSTIYG